MTSRTSPVLQRARAAARVSVHSVVDSYRVAADAAMLVLLNHLLDEAVITDVRYVERLLEELGGKTSEEPMGDHNA